MHREQGTGVPSSSASQPRPFPTSGSAHSASPQSPGLARTFWVRPGLFFTTGPEERPDPSRPDPSPVTREVMPLPEAVWRADASPRPARFSRCRRTRSALIARRLAMTSGSGWCSILCCTRQPPGARTHHPRPHSRSISGDGSGTSMPRLMSFMSRWPPVSRRMLQSSASTWTRNSRSVRPARAASSPKSSESLSHVITAGGS